MRNVTLPAGKLLSALCGELAAAVSVLVRRPSAGNCPRGHEIALIQRFRL